MKSPQRCSGPGSPRRVLLVGWDAADWQMIQPMVDAGLMPTLAGVMQRGVWGNLATARPILSPMLWNTIATGKRPEQHGVLGFTEPSPDGAGVRPTQSTSRRCKALWNLTTHAGLRAKVVGWYASHPAEPIDGVMVSNQFERFTVGDAGVSPPPRGSVHPEELTPVLAPLRVAPHEIDASAILPFVPTAERDIRREGTRVGKLQALLAQTATVHAVATHLLSDDDWDFAAVYYEGIDRFGHEFMEFHPPKMEQVSAEDFEAYRECMTGAYRFHDMMLQTLLTLAGDDTAVLIVSDHGYYSDRLRPDPRPGKAGPTDWHRPFGVFAAQGPGLRDGGRLYGASIHDITPTVLHLLGLPAAFDMPGRVLAEAVATEPLPRIESWEEVEGPCGAHRPERIEDPAESRAALEQLVALGYIEPPSEDDQKTVRDTIASNQLQLAQSQIDALRFREAIATIERIDESLRGSAQVRNLLATCLLALDERAEARRVLDSLAAEEPDAPRTRMMLGVLELAEGRTDQAADHFRAVAQADPRAPGLHVRLGQALLEMRRYDEAISAFERALRIDGDSPLAFTGRARARLETDDYQGALEDAMTAAELVHQLPRAHYLIGRAHTALGQYAEAVQALELCVRQAPGMKAAHRALAAAYRALGQADAARDADMRAAGLLGPGR